MSKVQPEEPPTATVIPDGVDALGLCPYSEETVAGCRHYLPVSSMATSLKPVTAEMRS